VIGGEDGLRRVDLLEYVEAVQEQAVVEHRCDRFALPELESLKGQAAGSVAPALKVVP
jgi:hypothetical protein